MSWDILSTDDYPVRISKILSSVQLLGLGPVDYFLNTSGLWSHFQVPLEVAVLGSYWSTGEKKLLICTFRTFIVFFYETNFRSFLCSKRFLCAQYLKTFPLDVPAVSDG